MNILYTVASEGMGHATRSQVIVNHLIKSGHNVRIATGDRAYKHLEKVFPGKMISIEGFHLKYKRGAIEKWGSAAMILKKAPESLFTNIDQFIKLRREYIPDIVFTDFEPFGVVYAKTLRVPLISIDNMSVMDRCQLDIKVPAKEKTSEIITKGIIKQMIPLANDYIILSFFNAPVKKKKTTLIQPVVRDLVINAKPTREGHILVYQTSSSQDDLIQMLQSAKHHQFKVYGFKRREDHGNVQLYDFNEEGFVKDLASSSGVIINGGFSTLGEALYLHKPVFCVPIYDHFEQYVNGKYIEKMGYGVFHKSFTASAIKGWLYDLSEFDEALSKYPCKGNEEAFNVIDGIIYKYSKG